MATWKSRKYLPHIDGIHLIQHITFHLADSLPRNAIERMERELAMMAIDQQDQNRRHRIQELLDAGCGTCPLRRDDCAEIVQESLLHGDDEQYRLLAWTIMPNHVHALIQTGAIPLAKIVQSWKRHTARKIRGILADAAGPDAGTLPPFWHRNYWDRYIRDDRHLHVARSYIEQNPVKAGLAATADGWKWGSAGWRGD